MEAESAGGLRASPEAPDCAQAWGWGEALSLGLQPSKIWAEICAQESSDVTPYEHPQYLGVRDCSLKKVKCSQGACIGVWFCRVVGVACGQERVISRDGACSEYSSCKWLREVK